MGKKFSKPKEKKEFFEELIDLARVTRVVKGGRRMRFRATVVIGNRKGKVGLGVGKSGEVALAVQKAVADAKKTLLTFPIVDGTIAHNLQYKFKGAQILLMPAGPGTGIISGGATRKILDLAGVENVLTKRFGSTNKLTNAQATMKALTIIAGRTRKEDVKKVEKVEKVEKKETAEKKDSKKKEPKKEAKK
ncbi:30S ribosomal protein S5 [Candidatus Gracilibacteria bacterium]|nr:30S ribosomal protein S5 [Candidatus Gracilibacteria bacterium]